MTERLIVRQGDRQLSIDPTDEAYMASLGWMADKPVDEPEKPTAARKAAPKKSSE